MPKRQTDNHKDLSVYITPEEKDLILTYTKVPLKLVEKIEQSIKTARMKKSSIKRVKVPYSLKELDIVLKQVAITSNQSLLPCTKYQLDSLFGRLATKFNQYLRGKD